VSSRMAAVSELEQYPGYAMMKTVKKSFPLFVRLAARYVFPREQAFFVAVFAHAAVPGRVRPSESQIRIEGTRH
jgi:hypothetical protein